MPVFDPNNPYNLRGVRISPSTNTNTDYYFILIDMLATDTNAGFEIASPQTNSAQLQYNYLGTFDKKPTAGARTVTHLLPLYTANDAIAPNPPLFNNLEIVITDSTGNTRSVGQTIKGNPNSLKPPIVEVINGGVALSSNSLVITSSTNPTDQFIIFLVNSGGNSEALISDIEIVRYEIEGIPSHIYKCTLTPMAAAEDGVCIGATKIAAPTAGEGLPEFVRAYFPGIDSYPSKEGALSPINYGVL